MKKYILLLFASTVLFTLSNAQSSSVLSDFVGIPLRSYAGLHVGITGFYGDVRNNHWMSGGNTIKADFMSEIGTDGNYAARIGLLFGQFSQNSSNQFRTDAVPASSEYPQEIFPLRHMLGGYEEGNLNFRTRFFELGFQGEYRLNHLPIFRSIFPYFSTGLKVLFFNPYVDRSKLNEQGEPILYESLRLDGQEIDILRNMPVPDGIYETRLKTTNLYGEKIKTVSVGFPLEIGFDLRVLPMIHIRCGTSFTFTLTDYIDGVSGKVARAARATQEAALAENPANYWTTATEAQQRAARLPTNKSNDFYSYTYVACYIKLPI
ncbi:MAG: hypothetical protein ACRCSB_05390 [Bacteroidales bacterium]